MVRPKKHLGQHFLTDHSIADRIVKALNTSPGDTVGMREAVLSVKGSYAFGYLHAEKGLSVAENDIFTGGEIARKNPVKRFMHYHEMLADPDIDAVIIATPDHHHATMAIDAVSAGKHVYLEKAPIHREEEIELLYQAVKNSGVVFQMGHQIPQNAVFQQAKEIINRGLLGSISHLETTSNRNNRDGAWIRHLDSSGNPKPGDERSIDWKQWLGKAPDAPFSIERYYGWARFFDYETGLYGQLFSHEYDAINQLLSVGIPETVSATGPPW